MRICFRIVPSSNIYEYITSLQINFSANEELNTPKLISVKDTYYLSNTTIAIPSVSILPPPKEEEFIYLDLKRFYLFFRRLIYFWETFFCVEK